MDINAVVADIGRKVGEVAVFQGDEDFAAVAEAKDFLAIKDYEVGSMQRAAPIGFASSQTCCGISKWRNMTKAEHKSLDGVMLADSFRHGPVSVVFFAPNTTEAISGE